MKPRGYQAVSGPVSAGRVARVWLIFLATCVITGVVGYYFFDYYIHYSSVTAGCEKKWQAEHDSAMRMLDPASGHCRAVDDGVHAQASACIAARDLTLRDRGHDIRECYEEDLRRHERHKDAYHQIWLSEQFHKRENVWISAGVVLVICCFYISVNRGKAAVGVYKDRKNYGVLPDAVVVGRQKEPGGTAEGQEGVHYRGFRGETGRP